MDRYTTTRVGPTKRVRVVDFLSSIPPAIYEMFVASVDDLVEQLARKKIGNPDPLNPSDIRIFDGVLSSKQPPKGYDWLVEIGDEITEELI